MDALIENDAERRDSMARIATVARKTKETDIRVTINLDGTGICNIDSGIGFFDHMLNGFARHGMFDLELACDGDTFVDSHHTIEDCGIALGQAFRQALGDRFGIARYGSKTIPMDESLATVDLDISGRPYLVFHCEFKREQIGMMSTEMVEEFFRAFAVQAGVTLHINLHYGTNDHHKAEAIFKAFARAIREAVREEGNSIPSSKGMLE